MQAWVGLGQMLRELKVISNIEFFCGNLYLCIYIESYANTDE
jgi:hypothetical protein